ncbi:MAG: hypothetical protein QM488_09065 [Rhizobiaceae bacterium]
MKTPLPRSCSALSLRVIATHLISNGELEQVPNLGEAAPIETTLDHKTVLVSNAGAYASID